MYVKRIRKIKNYKEQVVILKIMKDMDSIYPLHGEEHHWMSPPTAPDDWWGTQIPDWKTPILFFVFSTLTPTLANVKD